MRATAIMMATLAVLLQACVPGVLTGDAATGDAPALAAEDIATTALADPLKPAMVDAAEPVEAVAATSAPAGDGAALDTQPKPRPETVAEVPAEAAAPEAAAVTEEPKSRQQIKCEKSGGRWSVIGGGAGQSCVQPTRDGGKTCDEESDCDGQCLARSKTCAPFDPLWGCNEVLQEGGSRVTLCLD
jgi:hypothetical protein